MKGKKHESSQTREAGDLLLYLKGRIEAQAEFAKALGVLSIELTERMGGIFSSPEGRALLGAVHRVPDMPDETASRSSLSREMALAGSSHGKATRQDPSDQVARSAEELAIEEARRKHKRLPGKEPQPKPDSNSDSRPAPKAGNGKGSAVKSYWDKMTPQERKIEMRRRTQLSVTNKTRIQTAAEKEEVKSRKNERARLRYDERKRNNAA